jgi:probable F420-dependent oxidoreductase
MTQRWGITIPLEGLPLADHREVLQQAEESGYTDAWSAEVNGADAFIPLCFAAAWTRNMQLGTAIANVFTRTPMLLAMSAAGVAEAAPGRFVLGIGVSSPAIVERWNGVPLRRPMQRMRDVLAFLREALAGERVAMETDSFRIDGARLARAPQPPPPIYVAALREKMLALAAAEGDGVILNWLSPSDVAKVMPVVREAAKAAGKDPALLGVACRIFVIPTENEQMARMIGRFAVSAYLTTPVYFPFHQWLGRGEALAPMMQAWQAGQRREAAALVPDKVIDDILVYGSRQRIIDRIKEYCSNGVTIPVLSIIPTSREPHEQALECIRAVKWLAPA